MLLRHNKFQIQAKVSLKPEDKYHLVSESELNKLAGKPNPKRHSQRALFYFTTAIGFLYVLLSLSEYTFLKTISLVICLFATITLGIFQQHRYITSVKRKKLLQKTLRKSQIEII